MEVPLITPATLVPAIPRSSAACEPKAVFSEITRNGPAPVDRSRSTSPSPAASIRAVNRPLSPLSLSSASAMVVAPERSISSVVPSASVTRRSAATLLIEAPLRIGPSPNSAIPRSAAAGEPFRAATTRLLPSLIESDSRRH